MSNAYIEELKSIETFGEALEYAIAYADSTPAKVYNAINVEQSNFGKILRNQRNLNNLQILAITKFLQNTIITDWIAIQAGLDPLSKKTNLGIRLQEIESELARHKELHEKQEKKNQALIEVLTKN